MGINAKTNRFIKATVIAAIVGLCIFAQPAFATEIGNTGNFIPGNNGVYDITPETLDGNVGFRQYEKFNLDNGDVANLIFKQGGNNIETFVNMVDNTININGIVNTMRDGAFYNGRAVFISPNGMIVGPTGVLNVGALQILTPANDAYSTLKSATNISNYLNAAENIGTGVITINGKVFASAQLGLNSSILNSAGETVAASKPGLEIKAGSVNIGEDAGVIAGIRSIDRHAVNQLSDADTLFEQLVNFSKDYTDEYGYLYSVLMSAEDKEGTGINIAGNVIARNTSNDNALSLESQAGIKIASTGSVKSHADVYYTNNNTNKDPNAKMILQGETFGHNVTISNSDSDIIVGDANVDKQVVGARVTVTNSNGDILSTNDKGPNGEAKTHFVSSDKMSLTAINGSIGDASIGGLYSGDSNADVSDISRDIGTSVNINAGPGIFATASNDINLTSIDKDMSVYNISSENGRVILLADSAVKGETPYSILTSRINSDNIQVSGKDVSLIASGRIGGGDYSWSPKCFDIEITDPENGNLSLLTKTGDIDVKIFADEAKVSTVIAKEGDVNMLFTGNADITEVTAAKDINIAAVGKTLNIENLGSVPNTPTDYYGDNTYIAPKNVLLTAIDIANGVTSHAQSEVIVTNARVKTDADITTPEITVVADNSYIDGKHFIRDDSNSFVNDNTMYVRFTEVPDDRTNTVQSIDDNEVTVSANPVIPKDVRAAKFTIIKGEANHGPEFVDSRNYYEEYEVSLPEPEPTPEPVVVPEHEPTPNSEPNIEQKSNKKDNDNEVKRTFNRKVLTEDTPTIDKRQYMRFRISDNRNLVELESNPLVDSLIDISRGGVAIKHHKSLKVGDIVPIQLSFGGLDIDTNVKIVTATDVRAGAEFVDLDHATANKLLYMNILLQEAYGGNGLIKIK